MKRKVLGVLLSVAMVATMVAGCGSSSEPKKRLRQRMRQKRRARIRRQQAERSVFPCRPSLWSAGTVTAHILTSSSRQQDMRRCLPILTMILQDR